MAPRTTAREAGLTDPREGSPSATGLISLRVKPGREREYQAWQQGIDAAASRFDGFQQTEVLPPVAKVQDDWVIAFRFRSAQQLQAWLDSDVRRDLLDQAEDLLSRPARELVLAGAEEGGGAPDGAVTAVVTHEIAPGREHDFLAWQSKVAAAEGRFPGFLGTQTFPPVPGLQEDWVIVVRFDSRDHLQAWLDSDARRRLLEEGRPDYGSFDVRKVASAFGGWFRFDETPEAKPPPDWKQAMAVLLALYPTVMLLTLSIGRLLTEDRVPLYLNLFIGNVVSVALLTWVLMPLATRSLAFWLSPAVPSRRRNLAGAALLVGCYAVSVLVFALVT